MTSGLRNSAGTDFDSLFATGQGDQLFYIYANDGTDVGQRYLPASAGSSAASCSFLDSAGNDIGPKLCKIGTQYSHIVTVCRYAISQYGDYSLGYNGGGQVVPKTLSGVEITGLYWCWFNDGSNSFNISVRGRKPFTGAYIKRQSTGLTLTLSYRVYYSDIGLTLYSDYTSSSRNKFFSNSDVGNNVQVVITTY